MIKGAISSIQEGGGAFVEAINHAVEGDSEKALKDFARFGLEAAGLAAAASGAPQAEVIQETLEKALDEAVLEKKTGDVPGPGGDAESGGVLAAGGEGGVLGGPGGTALLGKILGAALEGALASESGGAETGSSLESDLADVGAGLQEMQRQERGAREAQRRVQNAAV